ncbi:hypothetical protein [Paludisphaera soli]|uniref:hypothetical protein n=1 Tax=Paludisphaera soli TaxID=2712865 RepID=UPI0013EADC78|nr:hypothetical protein [Paludisphaera soli]
MDIRSGIRGRLGLRSLTLACLGALAALAIFSVRDHLGRLRRDPEIRRLLVRGTEVEPAEDGRFPWSSLARATWRGKVAAARKLVDLQVDPESSDLDEFRALTLAVAEGRWDVVRGLLRRVDAPASRDGEGGAPPGEGEAGDGVPSSRAKRE